MTTYQYEEQGARLKKVRELLGITRLELANRIPFSENFYGSIERGRERLHPKIAHIFAIEHDVNIHWLITGEGKMFMKDYNDVRITHKEGSQIDSDMQAKIEKLEKENYLLKELLKLK